MDSSKEGEDSALLVVTKSLTDPQIGQVDNAQLNRLPNNNKFLRNLLGLLGDLHVQGDLVSNLLQS